MHAPTLTRKTSHPHSRGQVICDACFTTIKQGLMYRRDTWKDGTYHWSLRYCPDCWPLLDEVEAATHPAYGGPDANHYEQWAATHADTKRAQSWLLRAFPN